MGQPSYVHGDPAGIGYQAMLKLVPTLKGSPESLNSSGESSELRNEGNLTADTGLCSLQPTSASGRPVIAS